MIGFSLIIKIKNLFGKNKIPKSDFAGEELLVQKKYSFDDLKNYSEKIIIGINQTYSKIPKLASLDEKYQLILNKQETLKNLYDKIEANMPDLNLTEIKNNLDSTDEILKKYHLNQEIKENGIELCINYIANIVAELNKIFDL